MNTKQMNQLQVDAKMYNSLVEKIADREVYKALNEFKMPVTPILDEIELLLSKKWVEFEGKNFRYSSKLVGFIPRFKSFHFGEGVHWECDLNASYMNFGMYKGEILSKKEFIKLFPKETTSMIRANEKDFYYFKIMDDDVSKSINISSHATYLTDSDHCLYIPIYRLNGINSKPISTMKVFKLWMEHNLRPIGLSTDIEKLYKNLQYLIANEFALLNHEGNLLMNMDNSSILIEKLKSKAISLGNIDYEWILDEIIAQEPLEISDVHMEVIEGIKEDLLYCDYNRADIEPYPEKKLVDPNEGHWELWEEEKNSGEMYAVRGDFGLVARNPLADINENGVVGIDFGTKSTVVTYLDHNKILPMRVGTGKLSKKINEKHYENPTVMEFLNVDSFLHKYHESYGRPHTSWEDVLVSHTAEDDMVHANSTEFNAFIYDLKQWAGDDDRIITLVDKKGEARVLKPFHYLDEDEFNPIELYAYYIGLYINNMWNGIYLDYMLSFPVTYDVSTRTKIAKSFEKGLKKSLPTTVLQHEETIARFRIDTDISEPAAYAVCALQEYGFDPVDEEKVFYGIFDFGGGTTDFDFGLWRAADRKERRYDYVIEHFGAGGDKYLGGENLLELIAFETFKANEDLIRENRIMFTMPPECKRFPGSEAIVGNSQEARLNTKQLMEKLRPVWERSEGYEAILNEATIKVKLFNSTGADKDYDLLIDQEQIERIIENRIEKGIRNFFAALAQSFRNHETKGVEQVNIFLAGNSSKSQVVHDIFARYMVEETEKIRGELKLSTSGREYFKIFPPLGSKEAVQILDERGIVSNKFNLEKPNGKTGVAFGLLRCRKGSKIKVVDKGKVSKGTEKEITFQYFLGYERKGRFHLLDDLKLAKSVYGKPDYHTWYNYIDASLEDFELYYTKFPEAVNGEMVIEQAMIKRERIDFVDDDAFVYIRAVEPKLLEYVVATEEGIEKGDYLSPIKQILLDER